MADRAPTHTRKSRNNREAILESALWEFINCVDEAGLLRTASGYAFKKAPAATSIIQSYLNACQALDHKPTQLESLMPSPTLNSLVKQYLLSGFPPSPLRAWLTIPKMRVYVRVTRRSIHGDIYPSLDVASVEVAEHYRGKGTFRRWLTKTEKLASKHGMIVFAESILEPRLIGFFKERGYLPVGEAEPQCLYLPPKDKS